MLIMRMCGIFRSAWEPWMANTCWFEPLIILARTFLTTEGTFSVVLLAIIDAAYRFIYVDDGSYDKKMDGEISMRSSIGRALDDGRLNLPLPETIIGAEEMGPFTYVFVAGEEFPLKENLFHSHPVGRRQCTCEQLFEITGYQVPVTSLKTDRIAVYVLGDLSKDIRIENTECHVNCESNLRVTQVYSAHIHTSCNVYIATGLRSKAVWRCPKSWWNGQPSSRWCHCSKWKVCPTLRYNGAVAWQEASNRRGVDAWNVILKYGYLTHYGAYTGFE